VHDLTDKKQLRHQLSGQLSRLTPEQIAEKSRLACKNVIESEHFQKASVVMLFLSLPHEVDTSHIILHAWQQNKTVAVPKVSWQQRHMIPVELNSLETEDLSHDRGLRHPVTTNPVAIEEIDLVLTPGLAYDNKGNRLGRGGGFYDKFFNSEMLTADKCGLVFASQIIDSIPTADHDMPVDLFVTDQGIVHCEKLQNETIITKSIS
jgi:5-formyltetrahydrofolate cyclo-ligase